MGREESGQKDSEGLECSVRVLGVQKPRDQSQLGRGKARAD